MSDPTLTRREELLADGALAWLEGADLVAFQALLRDEAARAEFERLEQAAAIAAVAVAAPPDEAASAPLVGLTAKLQADALAFFATRKPPRPTVSPETTGRPWREPLRFYLPWLMAAASVVLLLWPVGRHAPLPPAAAREALLQASAAVIRCAWQPGPSPRRGAVAGDVVWDGSRQEGYLRLRGLPPLAPTQRYQLWIVDAKREGPPVDGGLLSLPTDAEEVVIPVTARLSVQSAAAFVLTVESAEGVVVSAQEHVVAIAKP